MTSELHIIISITNEDMGWGGGGGGLKLKSVVGLYVI